MLVLLLTAFCDSSNLPFIIKPLNPFSYRI